MGGSEGQRNEWKNSSSPQPGESVNTTNGKVGFSVGGIFRLDYVLASDYVQPVSGDVG